MKNKKKIVIMGLASMLCLGLVGCGKGGDSKEASEIKVFAAASMTESLNKISENYLAEKNTKVSLTLDSSGTLKTQIENGADCDVFISAAENKMDELMDKGLIINDTKTNLLENQVVLATAPDKKDVIKGFEDLNNPDIKKIGLGNSDVPVGQYSEELLKNINLWDALQPKISLGSNVKEVTTWIKEGVVDYGIVYSTDAKAAGLQIVSIADSNILKTQVIYPAGVVKATKNEEGAKAFLDYIKSNEEAKKVFTEAGFKVLN